MRAGADSPRSRAGVNPALRREQRNLPVAQLSRECMRRLVFGALLAGSALHAADRKILSIADRPEVTYGARTIKDILRGGVKPEAAGLGEAGHKGIARHRQARAAPLTMGKFRCTRRADEAA